MCGKKRQTAYFPIQQLISVATLHMSYAQCMTKTINDCITKYPIQFLSSHLSVHLIILYVRSLVHQSLHISRWQQHPPVSSGIFFQPHSWTVLTKEVFYIQSMFSTPELWPLPNGRKESWTWWTKGSKLHHIISIDRNSRFKLNIRLHPENGDYYISQRKKTHTFLMCIW